MCTEKIHVMPHPEGGWQIKREGSDKSMAIFETKKEAMARAKTLSASSNYEVVEHDGKGNVKKNSMTKVNIHVMPNPKGGWQIRRAGSDKKIETFETKEEAMAKARVLCGNTDAHLVEHSTKGKIKSVTKSKKQESPKKKTIVTKGKIVVRKGSTAEVRKTANGKTVVVIKQKSGAKKTATTKADTKKPAAKTAPAKKPATKKTVTKKTADKKPTAKKAEPKKKPVVVSKKGVVTKSSSGKTVVVRK